MESNWRWNVWAYGLGEGEIQLVSQILTAEYLIACKEWQTDGSWREVILNTSLGWPYEFVGRSAPHNASTPWTIFAYQFVPDHP